VISLLSPLITLLQSRVISLLSPLITLR
jgi:hypothetical protein